MLMLHPVAKTALTQQPVEYLIIPLRVCQHNGHTLISKGPPTQGIQGLGHIAFSAVRRLNKPVQLHRFGIAGSSQKVQISHQVLVLFLGDDPQRIKGHILLIRHHFTVLLLCQHDPFAVFGIIIRHQRKAPA